MDNLHEKIDKSNLQANGELLSASEKFLVTEIHTAVQDIKSRAQPTLDAYHQAQDRYKEINNKLLVISSPQQEIDNLLISDIKSPGAYKSMVLASLHAMRDKYSTTNSLAFFNQLIAKYETMPTDDRWDLMELMQTELCDLIEEFGTENLIDYTMKQQLENALDNENIIIAQEKSNLAIFSRELEEYTSARGIHLDVDADFNLQKISRRTKDLNFSILYVTNENQSEPTQAFVLYKGKGQILGAGQFGRVKLCQNLESGDWQAVKILQSFAKADSQHERSILATIGMFHGQAERNAKVYVVQTLLPGMELEKHIATESTPNITSRIEIAKQAIALVADFNKNFLHRDIKAANFIWDEENQKLYLCDFGLSIAIDEKSYEGCGSDYYKAPEIVATEEGEEMPYSTMSEMYAVGHTIETLFAGLENTPEGISEIITGMMAADPDARLGSDPEALIQQLESIKQNYNSGQQASHP